LSRVLNIIFYRYAFLPYDELFNSHGSIKVERRV